ncbi:hypothetical protein CDAR_582001 [Caerostris darwini]|uniref:Uncharacterized protein n=1 Tax=Caerostris darwini TaxID=1538125 RepID=A0AAV4X704_9ARAC|nr:hypothetical protein CDAR_582001 [Caerostris darwini]
MDKSPPNQVQPQLSGPSTSSSTPQENLTAQILQSLVKEVGCRRTAGARAPPPFRRRVTSRAARCQGGRKYCAGREGLQRKQPGWGPLAQGTPEPDDLF